MEKHSLGENISPAFPLIEQPIHINSSLILKCKGALILTTGVVLWLLESFWTLPAKGFNPKDLDTVLSGKACVGCDLRDANLYARDLRNVVLRNANLTKAKLDFANLKNADLSGADLRGAELSMSFLFGANLSGANLQGASLMGSYLHQANLERANLGSANLSRAFLFDANLREANLNGANFEGTTLTGANLTATNLGQAIFHQTLYDSSTRFPDGFNLNTAGLMTSTPSGVNFNQPDRYDAQRAELDQLSLARMMLGMGAYDQHAYGGCQDLSCFDPFITVNDRLLKLTAEVFGEQSPHVASELSALAVLYQTQEKYDKAEDFYRQALSLFEIQHNLSDTAETLRELARICHLQGRYDEAAALLEKALGIFQSSELVVERTAEYRRAFLEFARIQPELLEESSKISEEDLSKIIEQGNTDSTVRTLYELADVYLSQNKYPEAEAFYKRSLDLHADPSDYSMNLILLKLAWVHHAQGHRAEAEAVYQQVLKIYRESFPDGDLPGPILRVVNSIEVNLDRLQRALPPVMEFR